jgi:hypothetical protein
LEIVLVILFSLGKCSEWLKCGDYWGFPLMRIVYDLDHPLSLSMLGLISIKYD